MKINIFKNRILSEGKVYLLLSDCAEVLEADVDLIKNCTDNIIKIDPFGECITENEFNYILTHHFPDSCASIQLTNYDTLDLKLKEIVKLYPLKRMFAEDIFKRKSEYFNLSVEKYIEKIDFPEEVDREIEKLNIKYDIKKRIDKYRQEIEQGIKDTNNIPSEKYGVELQHLSIIEKGKIFIQSYYVGDGIFWSIMPEYMMDDIWEDSKILEDGTIYVPSVDYGEGHFTWTKDIKRDFRQYSVLDNILYCLYNIDAEDEWTDYVELRKGGVNIEISKTFLMKLINPRNCSNIYYMEGIPDIDYI